LPTGGEGISFFPLFEESTNRGKCGQGILFFLGGIQDEISEFGSFAAPQRRKTLEKAR
jgi:hypothetical protein